MKTVSMQEFLALSLADSYAFDTRSRLQYEQDALETVRHLALEQVQAGQHPDIPKDSPVYLICERGVVSELVGLYLETAGFSNVHNVAGGMQAYRKLKALEQA